MSREREISCKRSYKKYYKALSSRQPVFYAFTKASQKIGGLIMVRISY